MSFSLVAVNRGFSRVVMPGLLTAVPFLVVEHGLGHTVFSSCDLWAHLLWCMALVALWPMGSSWTHDQTHVPCIGRQILFHWTTKEFCYV